MIRPLSVFVDRRTWAELLYALLGLALGIAGFVVTVVTLTLSAGLAVTFVGLPLLAATGHVSRGMGAAIRRLGNGILRDEQIGAPPSFRPRPGLLGWIGSALRDGTAWRSRLYLLLKLPLGILSFVTAVVFWLWALGGISYPIWRGYLPCQRTDDGVCHHGASFGTNYFMDTPGRIALVVIAGALVLLAAPWLVHGVVRLDRATARVLLGPTSRQRVASLERSRAAAVDDAATTLRRIERDLHDGTQARLVALAMNVGLAREKLAEGGDPDDARALLDTAHLSAKEAIAEVRDLARGIHPPVLDAGLGPALETLASHSAVPVTVRTSLPTRPAPAIETMAYFCAAELITNVAKHSGAHSATVDVGVTDHNRLLLAVRDDGHGGAQPGRGSGLSGLVERIGSVDGELRIDSPLGGPTTALVALPMSLGRVS